MAKFRWIHARRVSLVGALLIACLTAAVTLAAKKDKDDGEEDAGAPGGGVAGKLIAGGSVTDAQVVAAMHKGIDYLLSVKKGDNWDIHPFKSNDKGETGGETALVLYALIHAGDSLQDDPTYHAKLNPRGKELAPVVQWLEKNPAKATYVAGLEAVSRALTLLTKRTDEKPGEGPAAALDSCKYYILLGMGPDGGYTYYANWVQKLEEAWQAYAKNPSSDKKELDNAFKALKEGWGGTDIGVQMLVSELKHARESAKDPREIARIDAEMKELDKYAPTAPESDAEKQQQAVNKKLLATLVARNGNPAGLNVDGGTGKSKPPMTKEQLAAKIDTLKKEIAAVQNNAAFEPKGNLSNGQYGTLGAWALADYGIELPDHYWETQDRFWRKLQHPDGGWSYGTKNLDANARNTMTVAGIASLFVCQEFLDNELRLIPKPDKNIDAGLAWLANEYTGAGNYYYMYGVERVGLSSGLKFFGTKDWYKIGATQIVKHQGKDGQWSGNWPSTVDTSYALLFLSRGRNPVVFNKLQYDGPWNAREHDDAYITRWMSKRFEKPINWQVVNLHTEPEEWQDAPILLITGSQDPKFTPDDIAKLKAYVNAGGMIFSTADGGTKDGNAFTAAMQNYASAVVDKKYEMRKLPKDHPLFSKELNVDLPIPPTLLGMSNGTREVWIHSPADIGADWQMRRYANKPSFELGAALYFYASGKGSLRSKLQPLAVNAADQKPARTIDLARIDYPGNADPEPGAWPRLAKLALADFKTKINLNTVPFAQLDAAKYPIAHLTGTTRVTFTDDDVKALKTYLDGGGFLFIDVAGGGGGSADFAASAEKLLEQVYPNNALDTLSLDNPILTGELPDGAKTDVHLRHFADIRLNRRVTAANLQAIVDKGRTRVIFSQWDICSGFLGTNTWGILGYAPQTAEDLARNILLFAQNQAAPPAAAKK